MRQTIIHSQYDEERALYHLRHADVRDCVFAGPADGESALKECRDITVTDTSFSLRYPVWHADGFSLTNVEMDDKTRAALWYSRHGRIAGSRLHGIKAVRECEDIEISDSDIVSEEFGWKSAGITLRDSSIVSAYLFLDSRDIRLERVRFTGKYSFQYVTNLEISDCTLDTKDAFWHAKNVVVRDSIVKGEYLGWFSENLTLINCQIEGTQPLCYCKGLKLVDCTMSGCDLSFEYSEVEATVRGHIDSVKNPKSGLIVADSVGEIVTDDPVMECTGQVRLRGEREIA